MLLLLLSVVAVWAEALQPPPLPLHSSSRWILDANNRRVKLKCVNWGGHMEVNIPEGLHKQSVGFLAGWVADAGFNCVRLTYSTDMALRPDANVSTSFLEAAGPSGVSTESLGGLFASAVQKNGFLATATTRGVFGAVVDALWSRGVVTILDNHVSRASWCCGLEDGNGVSRQYASRLCLHSPVVAPFPNE
jgi:hypothetical protein